MRKYWTIAALVIIIDQLSKLWVYHHIPLYTQINVLPVFDLTLRLNAGAAWSFLANAPAMVTRIGFIVLAAVAAIAITIGIRRSKDVWINIALSLILGGAIGNMIDRIWLGQVVDFLLFYWGAHQFPAFNGADSAITLGAFLLGWDALLRQKSKSSSGATETAVKGQ